MVPRSRAGLGSPWGTCALGTRGGLCARPRPYAQRLGDVRLLHCVFTGSARGTAPAWVSDARLTAQHRPRERPPPRPPPLRRGAVKFLRPWGPTDTAASPPGLRLDCVRPWKTCLLNEPLFSSPFPSFHRLPLRAWRTGSRLLALIPKGKDSWGGARPAFPGAEESSGGTCLGGCGLGAPPR